MINDGTYEFGDPTVVWLRMPPDSWVTVVATYPSAGGRRVTRECVFQERNTRGVATNVYLRKTSEKPEKDVVYEL